MIQVKRAYEPTTIDDGSRFLVDRLWPRGVKRNALHLENWLKDVGNRARGFGGNRCRFAGA